MILQYLYGNTVCYVIKEHSILLVNSLITMTYTTLLSGQFGTAWTKQLPCKSGVTVLIKDNLEAFLDSYIALSSLVRHSEIKSLYIDSTVVLSM